MYNYDYSEAVKDDIAEYIEEKIDLRDYDDLDMLSEELYDTLFMEDSVTGNGSASYTFNTYEAEEYLCHNMGLLKESAEAFGYNMGELVEKGAEACDVTIRCYLLGECLDLVVDEIKEEFEAVHNE